MPILYSNMKEMTIFVRNMSKRMEIRRTIFILALASTVMPAMAQKSYFEASLFGTADSLIGAQIGVISSAALHEMRGVQLSGINNVAANISGVQIAGWSNVSTTPLRGLQLAGITNISAGVSHGTQLSVLANVSSGYMRGYQSAGYNYADTLNGTQVGILNVCMSHPRGLQVGLINYSHDTKAHKVGLININPDTKIDVILYGGNLAKGNIALRFRNKSTYSIIGLGSHYMGLDKKFSGSISYRLGQYFKVSPRWSLSSDIGFSHIETFEQNSKDEPERLFGLELRLNADYRITPKLAAFASVGYSDARYYSNGHRYKNKPIFEAGLAFRYGHSHLKENIESTLKLKPINTADSLYVYNDPYGHGKNGWRAAAEAAGINVLVHSFDRWIMNEEFAQTTLSSIGRNFRKGLVWDNDQFSTNLFAHPYHGNLYYNSARSNGLSFWESAPYSLGGSLMWEFFGEREPPAINDLMATTFGGICIGEMTHRVSMLVLDDSKRGFPRFLSEFLDLVINPIQGFNRIISGDAWRVRHQFYKYHDYERFPVDFSMAAGVRYLADDGGFFRGESNPFLNFFMSYGDAFNEEENKPYDFFELDATVGLSGNQPLINGLHILGRIWSAPIVSNDGIHAEFGIFQHFNYYDSKPVKDGTSLTPYRISEAASFGPGIIMKFPQVGALTRLEQRIFLSGILLGGTKSDYYNVIDRDYNMGSGFSVKTKTHMEFRHFGRFIMKTDYYRLFTWKGYEGKDLATVDPLYLNAQGDKGSAALVVLNPIWQFDFRGPISAEVSASYYIRNTYYKYHDNVQANTFDLHLGLVCHF